MARKSKSIEPISRVIRMEEGAAAAGGADVGLAPASAAPAAALPPINNMGGKSTDGGQGLERFKNLEPVERTEQVVMLITSDGPKELTVRAGWGNDLAHVDAVSFTFHESTLQKLTGDFLLTQEQYVRVMSYELEKIFGFGVIAQRERGLNYYADTWLLGDGYGFLSFGGQRETMLIQITGTGCAAACVDWEMRLYRWLSEKAVRPRLTRIDLAFDLLGGEYTVDMAHADAIAGLYTRGGRRPSLEKRGDWDFPDGSGRTLYVGKRANGKFCRVYEKGREQGDPNHPWVRVEVELKSVDRIIPLDALIDSGSYFAGCYPAFEQFRGMSTPTPIRTQQEEVSVTYEHLMHHANLQVGRMVNFLRDIRKMSADAIVEALSRADGTLPKRLKLEKIHCDFIPSAHYLHNLPEMALDLLGLSDEFSHVPA